MLLGPRAFAQSGRLAECRTGDPRFANCRLFRNRCAREPRD